MNYLAHAYLSFNNNEILVGNMISDYVKGKKKFDYAPTIQKGIMLHRSIDAFTDMHPATKQAAVIFKPVVGTYAGAFVDVVYDHFLATDESIFTYNKLASFAQDTYKNLFAFYDVLPERFQRMLPYMQQQNWLLNYSTMSGIASSFGGVFRRAKYIEHTERVFETFEKNYSAFKEAYNSFFPDVYAFAFAQYNELLNA